MAGHFFLQDIPRVLNVRINANIEDRVREEMTQENISAEKARYMLIKDDEERRKWGIHLYGRDTSDSNYYDIVINLTQLSVDEAVETLYDVSQRPAFQATRESRKHLAEVALIADIKASIFDYVPNPSNKIDDGVVHLHDSDEHGRRKPLLKDKIEEALVEIEEVKEIEFVSPPSDKRGYVNVFHKIG